MKFFRLISLLIVTFSILWLGGLMWFGSQIATNQKMPDKSTEAIIMLTGGSDRFLKAVSLLSTHYKNGTKLFVSGVGASVKITELYHTINLPKDEKNPPADIELLKERTELGYKAKDTKGNAIEAKEWVEKNNINSFFLVTSNYHMARSLLEFKKLMPDKKIMPFSVISNNVKLDGWWKYTGSREFIISEYNKYLAASVSLAIQKRGNDK